jgi:hypothetical protein
MEDKMNDVVKGINRLRQLLSDDFRLFVNCFDSVSTDLIRDGEKPWAEIDPRDVYPRGSSPLYDSITQIMIEAIERDSEKTFLIVILDGIEQCSNVWSLKTVKDYVKMFHDKDWEILLVGVDFEKVDLQSEHFGVSNYINTMMPEYEDGSFDRALKTIVVMLNNYKDNFEVLPFSQEEIKYVVGTKDSKA